MGAFSGAMSAKKYWVVGDVAAEPRKAYLPRIRLRLFRPLRPEEEEEERYGWCAIDEPTRPNLTTADVFRGRYVTLCLRLDRYRIPAAVLQAHLRAAAKEKLEQSSRPRLGRAEAANLKQEVLRSLRQRVLPSMRTVDCVWDTEREVLYFFSQSAQLGERLIALFELTFGLELVENSPLMAARRLVTEKSRLRQLDQVSVSNLLTTGD